MRKAIIYMEVACGHCGGIINRNYKNSTSVKWLKNATSDWRYTKAVSYTHLDVYKRQAVALFKKLWGQYASKEDGLYIGNKTY